MNAKFQVGDFVAHRANLEAIRLRLKPDNESFLDRDKSRLILGIVTEVQARTCHGGTQFFYAVQWGTSDGINHEPHIEIETVLAPAPTEPMA